MTCKWLISMVIVSPLSMGVTNYLITKWPNFMAYFHGGGDPNYLQVLG